MLSQLYIDGHCGSYFHVWTIAKSAAMNTLPASWEICMQVKKQQLKLDMGQQTGSK